MEAVHTEEYLGYIINIYPDPDPQNPRTEWDNLGTMALFTRDGYGDKHDYDVEHIREVNQGKHDDKYIWLPVYKYEHGRVGFSTNGSQYPFNCPWDGGQVGVILVEKQAVRKEWGWELITKKRREQIEGYLDNEVRVYHAASNGEVYGYEVEDQYGNHQDSCGGFYDTDQREWTYGGALAEARSIVNWQIKHENEEHAKLQMAMAI